MQRLAAALDTFSKKLPVEKLFIHTDKPGYFSGDTLWFKGYLLDAQSGAYSSRSGLVYLELISDSGLVAQRICVPAAFGLTWGQIILDETITEGAYYLRAYTNWMQNFGEDAFFKKRFYIANAGEEQWLVTARHSSALSDGKKQVSFGLQFKKQNNEAIGFKEIQWRVLDGRKTLAKSSDETLTSSIEGKFNAPAKIGNSLTIIAQDKKDPKQRVVVPINIFDPEDIDLQFMPEGGHLVAGLPSKVAFKAVLPNGKSTPVKGTIVDSKNNEVLSFESLHNGMGAFDIAPMANETYSAKIALPNGAIKSYALPTINPSGITIKVLNRADSDSIRVAVFLSADLLDDKTYRLTGFSRGHMFYGANFAANKQRVSGLVSKMSFPTGVAHFTVFNDKDLPVAERLVYIDHKTKLNININSAKATYKTRDSIALNLQVADMTGKPVQGSFSLSVTDDSQVNIDTLENNILSQFYLSSELKGTIEKPAFYFNGSSQAYQALDVLLLTQGWVGYNWNEIFKGKNTPVFTPEPGLAVSGKVLNAFNKPVSNSKVLLFANGKLRLIRDTVTNNLGRFSFTNFPPVDTVSFFVQARNTRGKSFNVGLEMEGFKPAKPFISNEAPLTPWYVNIDSTTSNLIKNKKDYKQYFEKLNGRNMLKDVVITAKRAIKNSKNLNGAGEADQIIDLDQISKSPAYSVLDLLQKQVKGFMLKTDKTGNQFFYVFDKRVRFVVDGIDLNRFYEPTDSSGYNQYYEYINSAFASLSPSEITGIEVMYNMGNTSRYDSEFLTSTELMGFPNTAYLEITTRSGNGIFFKTTPGIATYRPIPITAAKQFYQPRYNSASAVKTPDYRSTVYWQPHIYADNSGIASTNFYAADKPGYYTVLIQGSNMEGLLGYKFIKLKVEAAGK